MSIAINTASIQADKMYHIYNRAIGSEKLFYGDNDYARFLSYIKKYVFPHVSIYGYCLLPNHFHFLLQVNENPVSFSRGIADVCNGYAKYVNTKYNRRGGLFMSPYKRKIIEDDAALGWICWYIHRNPLHHGLTDDWQNWAWSSYKHYLNDTNTLLQKDFLIDFFGGKDQLIAHHQQNLKRWLEE